MIDLDNLGSLHPDLPDELAVALAMCAAAALQRRHRPGVRLAASVRGQLVDEVLFWREREPSDARMLDARRVTEDGAECVALALVGHCCRSWRLLRRLQSTLGEGADWLFEDSATGVRLVVEISGTDTGPMDHRLRVKMVHAGSAARGRHAAACVVRFLEPRASIWSNDEPA